MTIGPVRFPVVSILRTSNARKDNPAQAVAFDAAVRKVAAEPPPAETPAARIIDGMARGMTLEMSAKGQNLSRDEAVARLKEARFTVEVTDPRSANGDVRITKITDATGNVTTENYDFQHGAYYIDTTKGGKTTSTPVRDGLGQLQDPPIPPAKADHGRNGQTLDSVRRDFVAGQDKVLGGLPPQERQALADPKADISVADEKGEARYPHAATLVTALEKEMAYAGQDDVVPADALPALKAELKSRHPGDEAWAAAVDRAAERASDGWTAQGRTHAVLDPLYKMADPLTAENAQAFKTHAKNVFGAGAAMEPTRQAVERWRDTLLAYGPKDARSQQLIKDAAQEFLVTDPEAAAAEVKKAFDDNSSGRNGEVDGAGQAAKTLAELTDPGKVDPLSAALIAQQAQPTIDRITTALKPYDLDKIMSFHASDVNDNKRLAGDVSQAYADLSAAMDSAGRTDEGRPVVQHTAQALKDVKLVSNTDRSLLNGNGVTLSLEIARQLRADGKPDDAAQVEKAVLQGVNDLEGRMVTLGQELGAAAAPMVLPENDWKPFLPEGAAPDNWFTDDKTLQAIQSKSDQIDRLGVQLELAYQAIERSGPELQASPHRDDLLKKGQPDAMDPKLKPLLDSSPGAMAERLRAMNQAGLASGALEDASNIVPDPSWPTRLLRNTGVNATEATTGTRPKGTGLALFGLGTYVWGVSNKVQEGGASYVTAGLYFAGGATEAWTALGQLSNRQYGWRTTDRSWWKRAIAAAGEGTPQFQRAYNAPLRALGWWNAYNAVATASEGKLDYALLHGLAAGGIFAASKPFSGAANPLHKFKWIKTGGNALTLLASTALMFRDMHEKRKPIEALSDRHEQYLKAAGVDPGLAEALSILPGEDGTSVAGRLSALAEYRGTSEREVMEYLKGRKPRESFDLAYAAAYVKTGDDGTYPIGKPDPAWQTKPSIKADFRPMTIAELNQFIDHYMPGFPGRTP